MTKFWPVSVMLNSPALRPEQKLELINYWLIGVSENTLHACHLLAGRTRSADITMLYTEGTSLRRVYLKRPTQENWLSLEREIFIDTGENFGLNIDTLH